VKTILRAAEKNAASGTPLKVVSDQIGNPTHTVDVCHQVMALLGTPEYGLYHSTSEGACSWFDFAQRIVQKSGIKVDVLPCTTQEYPRPAPRPAYSVLENARLKALGLNRMPDWQDAYDRFWPLYQAAQKAGA
jgi:dTDP-4-dehydrorhamnose reductase